MEFVNYFMDSEHLGSTLRDFAEMVLDPLVNEGVLRDLPFFNTFYNFHKTYGTIKQQQFTNTIKNFLKELSNLSYEERR